MSTIVNVNVTFLCAKELKNIILCATLKGVNKGFALYIHSKCLES